MKKKINRVQYGFSLNQNKLWEVYSQDAVFVRAVIYASEVLRQTKCPVFGNIFKNYQNMRTGYRDRT